METTIEPPSGRQHTIAYGSQQATVVEVGGGLRVYSVAGHQVFDGYSPEVRCTGARGQVLVPWPNRLGGGHYSFGGDELRVPLNEPEKGNAIHGLVRWANWHAVEHTDARVVMAHLLHPSPGYPFTLALRLAYMLSPGGLSVRLDATNAGRTALPYGAGAHPYLMLGGPTVDPLVLRAPGTSRIVTDSRQLPTSTEPVDGTPYDFRKPRRIGDAVLDTGYADLLRDGDGRATVELATEDGARRVTLWMDAAARYLMLFTGDTLKRKEERRRSLGVEPMTCAPNAFATGEGLDVLEPAQTSSMEWGIAATGFGP
ncbi:MAG: aldose 1-epimerase family protein [Acidimicrobiales bacterium]